MEIHVQPGHPAGRARQNLPTSRKELTRAMRHAAMPLRAIAEAFGITSHDDHPSTARRVPVLGWLGSRSCYSVPVSLPRVSILEAA